MDTPHDTTTKTCKKCGKTLPATLEYFYAEKRNKDGLNGCCAPCMREYNAKNRRKKNIPARTRETQVIKNGNKQCVKCKRWLPADKEHFWKASKVSTGFSSRCKECEGCSFGINYYRSIADTSEGNSKKCCPRCKRELPANNLYFYSNKNRDDGLHNRCKECDGYSFSLPEPPDGYKRCSNCKKILVASTQHFHRRNISPDGLSSRCKPCARLYKSSLSDWYSNYKKRPSVKMKNRLYAHKRRTKKRNLPNNFTADDWNRALDYFHGCCAVCGRQLTDLFGDRIAAMDHWIPLNYNGKDNPGTVVGNILPLCHGVDGCNDSKGDKMPDEWLEWKFNKRKAKQILKRVEEFFEWVRNQ